FFLATPPSALPTLSLHDALPIFRADAGHDVRISGRADDLLDLGDLLQLAHRLLRVVRANEEVRVACVTVGLLLGPVLECRIAPRSEEHTSELQSRFDLVCRLLLE